MSAVRLAAVKYLNTLPLLAGLQASEVASQIDLRLEHPAHCAMLLRDGVVDIALCPIGALTEIEQYHVVSDYGIGCDGAVRTVAIYSHRPLHALKYIVLYPESRTSNLLAQVLENEHWHLGLEFGSEPPVGMAQEEIGHLCIGDQCFEMERQYPFTCDLGAAWKDRTGLPFVFACWTSLSPVNAQFEDKLNKAFEYGLETLNELAIPHQDKTIDVYGYLRNNIDFNLDGAKRKAMQLFLNSAKKLPVKTAYVAEDPF